MKKVTILIPCYNEEEVLPETSKRLKEQLGHLVSNSDDIADDTYHSKYHK